MSIVYVTWGVHDVVQEVQRELTYGHENHRNKLICYYKKDQANIQATKHFA